MTSTDIQHPLQILFDGTHAGVRHEAGVTSLTLPIPYLGGRTPPIWNSRGSAASCDGSWRHFYLPEQDLHLAFCIQPVQPAGLETVAEHCYRDLFQLTQDHNLYRIWNYVPQINQIVEGMENYRAFCAGRSQAFHQQAGDESPSIMPAASGLGCHGDHLIIVALFGPEPIRHLENPLQVPAYRYPETYGPKPPSFARGTVLTSNPPFTFISGTAAVRGHQSVGGEDVAAQTKETIRNLKSILHERHKATSSADDSSISRHFTVYLRNRRDQAIVESLLRANLLEENDEILWLEADICRAELMVEIEVILFPIHPRRSR